MQLVEALDHLLAAVTALPAEWVPVRDACGRIAAGDIAAPVPVPHFSRAAMDGYVCHDADLHDVSSERPVLLRVTGAVRMGEPPGTGPDRGEAWSITTGGPIPGRGDRVLPIEAARLVGDRIRIERPVSGKPNIAGIGEDIRAGSLLAAAGSAISAPVAGALAACGIRRVNVRRRPRVALVATGTELVDPDESTPAPPPGRVFNSNSVMLAGELQMIGCTPEYQGIVSDRPGELREVFQRLWDRYDVVVSTGGVSVGRHDAVHRTWLDLGARRLVGRVDLKPGGPFFAAHLGETWVIGLSGTPVACLAAFHLLVRPFFRRIEGRRYTVRPLRMGRLAAGFPRATDRMRALWARVAERGGEPPLVELLVGTPEGNFASVRSANALVLLPPGTPPLPAGSHVAALMLDQQEDRDGLSIPRPEPGPAVVGVTGVSGSGKTTVIVGLLRRLTAAGFRVAAMKHAAHGFSLDHSGSDSARMLEAGASLVVLAGPAETAIRTAAPVTDPDLLIRIAVDVGARVWSAIPDLILIEGFRHPGRPVIWIGDQKPGVGGGDVWATIPAAAGLSPAQLDAEIERVSEILRTRLAGAG